MIGHHKIIIFRMFKINQPDDIASFVSVFLVANFYAFGQQAVKGFIIGNEFRRIDALYGFEGFFLCGVGNVGIDSSNGIL